MKYKDGYARSYRMGYTDEVEAAVSELRLPNNATVQATVIPAGNGFLIRVWPANGTHEHGGDNMIWILKNSMDSHAPVQRPKISARIANA